MIKQFGLKIWLLLGCSLCAVWLVRAVEKETEHNPANTSAAGSATTNILIPGPNDGKITYVAARMLEQSHFLRHPLDDEFSQKFFDRYIETFDPQHMHFTEADLVEFDSYRTNLDDLTLTRRREADITPAYKIYGRFFERLEQRVAFAEMLLKNEKFEFDNDERILLNRKEAPYPRGLDEAKELWRQRLRFEYLQEKLGQQETKKKSDSPVVKKDSSPATPDRSVVATKEQKKKTGPEEIVETLTRRYQRNLRMFKEWDNDDLLQTYINALARVYDPHSDYFNMRQADNFAIGMNLALFGIGAELFSDDGYCTIRRLTPNGPAEKSNAIKAKDRIVAVAQSNAPPVDAVEMKLDKVVQMIRGPKGTEVRLTVVSPDDPSERRIVTLIRDEIKLEDQAAKAKIIELPVGDGKTERLGVIDLPSFYATIDLGTPRQMLAGGEGGGKPVKATPRSTSVDVAKLLAKLKSVNVSGVILDLRRNGGGSLEEAVKLTGLFIKEGPVVQVSGPDGEPMVDDDPDPSVLYEGPLIVLTSRFSASASEILAGALQDYGRALIVGDVSTHGKGTVQNLNSLRSWVKPATATATDDPGALKITIRKFYRAGGASTQLKGVMPDIVLPSVFNYSKDIGESALENPLAWDTIPSARFDKLNLVEPCLPELLQRSNGRIATNQDFAYIHEDIDIFKKRQADKTISLNERERLKEKETDDARQKTRDKERLARKDPDQKVYELTLKQVELLGLPPPVEKTNTSAKAFAVSGASPAGNTPSAGVTPKSISPAGDDEGAEPEDKAPAVDPTLDEAQRILVDYIALLSEKKLLTAKH